MLGSIGMPELIVIFIVALIVFGPKKLPELGKSLGQSIAQFKRASNELRNTLDEEIRVEDRKQAQAAAAAAVTTPPAIIESPALPAATPVADTHVPVAAETIARGEQGS